MARQSKRCSQKQTGSNTVPLPEGSYWQRAGDSSIFSPRAASPPRPPAPRRGSSESTMPAWQRAASSAPTHGVTRLVETLPTVEELTASSTEPAAVGFDEALLERTAQLLVERALGTLPPVPPWRKGSASAAAGRHQSNVEGRVLAEPRLAVKEEAAPAGAAPAATAATEWPTRTPALAKPPAEQVKLEAAEEQPAAHAATESPGLEPAPRDATVKPSRSVAPARQQVQLKSQREAPEPAARVATVRPSRSVAPSRHQVTLRRRQELPIPTAQAATVKPSRSAAPARPPTRSRQLKRRRESPEPAARAAREATKEGETATCTKASCTPEFTLPAGIVVKSTFLHLDSPASEETRRKRQHRLRLPRQTLATGPNSVPLPHCSRWKAQSTSF